MRPACCIPPAPVSFYHEWEKICLHIQKNRNKTASLPHAMRCWRLSLPLFQRQRLWVNIWVISYEWKNPCLHIHQNTTIKLLHCFIQCDAGALINLTLTSPLPLLPWPCCCSRTHRQKRDAGCTVCMEKLKETATVHTSVRVSRVVSASFSVKTDAWFSS